MSLLQRLQKKLPKTTNIMHKDSSYAKKKVDVVSTGVLAVDVAVGIGGLPRGRMVEIFGRESSGKTTLALHTAAEVQRAGGTVGIVDMEHALDPVYAAALGVDVDELYIVQPDDGESALNAVEVFVEEGISLVIVDSVASLVPKAEIEGEMGASHMGLQARLMSQACRKLTPIVSANNAIVLWINQTRQTIGGYGGGEVTTGGNALKFYTSVRLQVLAGAKDAGPKEGRQPKIRVVKNKLSQPFKEVSVDMLYGRGFCKEYQVMAYGEELGLIEKSGTWYSYDGEKWQGRNNLYEYLFCNPSVTEKLWAECRKALEDRGALPS